MKRLVVTGRGRRALGEARRIHGRFERELGKRLGAQRVATARGVLESIIADAGGHGLEMQSRPF